MEKDRDIQFKPLTDGLGFHPFADGLPYAPTSKVNPPVKNQGTGATAAGRPIFIHPPAPKNISTPVDPTFDLKVDRIKKELEIFAQEKSSPKVQSHPPLIAKRYGLGYSLQRFFAYLIDSAFNLSLCAAVLSTALLTGDAHTWSYFSSTVLLITGAFLFLCNWSLITAQEVAFGTSLGKRIFGLKLQGSGMEVFVRAVLFIPSLIFSGLGIVMAVFDPRKRCWHDRATQLQPEEY